MTLSSSFLVFLGQIYEDYSPEKAVILRGADARQKSLCDSALGFGFVS